MESILLTEEIAKLIVSRYESRLYIKIRKQKNRIKSGENGLLKPPSGWTRENRCKGVASFVG